MTCNIYANIYDRKYMWHIYLQICVIYVIYEKYMLKCIIYMKMEHFIYATCMIHIWYLYAPCMSAYMSLICHMRDTYMQTYMVFICTLYVCIYV